MKKDVLVVAELAKEKLARIPEKWIRSKTCDPSGAACTHQIMANEIVQLIRNTDLTDCAPDQGSVRNATDMRERCAEVCDNLAQYGPAEYAYVADHCAAAIRALPDQKD